MSGLARTPIHRALYRPTMIAGGERELVLMTGIVAGGLILTVMTPAAFVVGVLLYAVNMFFLRLMAKADPQMSKVYLRQLKYRNYYHARGHYRDADGD